MNLRTFAGLIAALICSFTLKAQNPQEIPVRYNGTEKSGVAAAYDYSKDLTEQTLETKLKAAGLTRKSRKDGFTYYKEATWPAITVDKVDVYVKVTGNSKSAAVSILVSKGYDNFITSATDAQAILNLKNFLSALSEDIAAYQKELELKAQQEKVAAAQRAAEKSARDAERAAKKQEQHAKQQAKDQKKLEEEQKKMQNLKTGN